MTSSSSFYGSETVRKSWTNHMDHALNAIITSSMTQELHFQGWHLEVCDAFIIPSFKHIEYAFEKQKR